MLLIKFTFQSRIPPLKITASMDMERYLLLPQTTDSQCSLLVSFVQAKTISFSVRYFFVLNNDKHDSENWF